METEHSLKIVRRTSKDIATRSVAGIIIYPVFWPLIAYGSHFDAAYPNLVLSIAILHVLISGARIYHVLAHDKIPDASLSAWMKISFFLVVLQGFTWGSMFGLSLIESNDTFRLFMTLSAAGVVAGGANTFAPNKGFSFCFALAVMLPAIFAGIYQQEFIICAILFAYVGYIFGLANNQNKEYWRSINNEQLLEKQSRTDSLTKLDNRRFFDEKLQELCHLSSRNHEILAVLVVDCDHFKTINDDYGHDVGDVCLQHVAETLRQSLPRATDICARYGGEEFSLLLPGTDAKGALVVAERIRQNVESSPLVYSDHVVNITVSIGLTAHHIGQYNPDLPRSLFKEADMALYQAKQSGRNRCVLFNQS